MMEPSSDDFLFARETSCRDCGGVLVLDDTYCYEVLDGATTCGGNLDLPDRAARSPATAGSAGRAR